MNRFAELLDALLFTPSRNGKLRLMQEYFAATADPERGWALAALTGELSFAEAKPSQVRDLAMARVDPEFPRKEILEEESIAQFVDVRRVAEHNAGTYDGYTAKRRPVSLVFSQWFDQITDAIAAERQVKGWSRAKKEALIRGDFDQLRGLSKRRTSKAK